MGETIAGKRLITCPACRCAVREDLLTEHMSRCSNRSSQPAAPPPLSPASQTHTRRGAPGSAEPVATPSTPVQLQAAAQERKQRRDSYLHCPYCGHLLHKQFYTRHLERCSTSTVAREASVPVPAEESDDYPKTRDGYRIDRCWDCGHRVCLVPDGSGGMRVYEIARDRTRGDRHVCDGRPESRRTKLTYVDSQLANIALPGKKRGRRKL